MICIYVERLAFKLEFGHFVPVRVKSTAAVTHPTAESHSLLNIHDQTLGDHINNHGAPCLLDKTNKE